MTERNETTQAKKRGGWKQWTPAEARRALAAWQKSGLSLTTFARERGLGAKKLNWWRSRLGGAVSAAAATPPPRKARFVPAVVTAPLFSLSTAAVAIRVQGNVVLEIADARAVPPEWVGILMAAAAKASR